MAKVTAPLLSFGAGGQIGKTVVFSKWRGRPYTRQYVTPSNPDTADQQTTRNTFSWLNRVYKTAPAGMVAPWTEYARGLVMSDRNAFIKQNLPLLRGDTTLADIIFSPGALGGLPPSAATFTPGNDQVTIVPTAPSPLPTGWTITKASALVIPDQNPASGVLYTVTYGEDLTSPYSINITGLLNAAQYMGGVWFEYLRPDGRTAYSPDFHGTFLTT